MYGGAVAQAQLRGLVQSEPRLQLSVQRHALVAPRRRKPRCFTLWKRLVTFESDAQARREVYQLVEELEAAANGVACARGATSGALDVLRRAQTRATR